MEFDLYEIMAEPGDTQGNVAIDAWSIDMLYPDYCAYALQKGVPHYTEEEYQSLCAECVKELSIN